MNAAVRYRRMPMPPIFNAKRQLENGFDLTNCDERTLAFAKTTNQLLACYRYKS